MLQALAGHDPNDPTSLTAPVPNMLDGLDRGIQGVRMGLDERYITEGVDGPVTEAVLAGVRDLEGLGAQVVRVRMPDTREFLLYRPGTKFTHVRGHGGHLGDNWHGLFVWRWACRGKRCL